MENKIFVDTSPIIYLLDEKSPLRPTAEQIFSRLLNRQAEFVTSTITCMEYLVFPYRTNNKQAINIFWEFLDACGIKIHEIDEFTAVKAAQIRASHAYFKTADSLQLATACVTGCDLFLTNDKQLRQFEELHCVILEDLNEEFFRRQQP